jgi:ankyrin repeat protein
MDGRHYTVQLGAATATLPHCCWYIHGADVDAPSPNGDTPVLMALRDGKTDVVPVLLAHGADACAHGDRGETPLHVLSGYFNMDEQEKAKVLELAKLLLEHGSDVNAIKFDGWTPLHVISGNIPFG